MQNAGLIEKQINNCRNLLKVFKEERESYSETQEIDMQMVMRMIQRKQEILTSFQMQKQFIEAIREEGHQDENQEKILLRELGKLLEQLLVIDQENEILLRSQIGRKPNLKDKSSASTPTLKPELPFCPKPRDLRSLENNFSDQTPPLTGNAQATASSNLNSSDENDSSLVKINRFSRFKLKAYGA